MLLACLTLLMRLMNHILEKFIGYFVVVYFEDILVYYRGFSPTINV